MAMNSGNFTTSNEYIRYRIELTVNSQDQIANTSNVTVKIWVWRTNTGFETFGNGTVYCTINGVNYSASIKSSQIITNSGIYLFNKTLTIPHNSDGTKPLAVSSRIDHSRFTSSTNSHTFELPTILRSSKITATGVELGTAMSIGITRDSEDFTTTVRWVCGSASGTIATQTTASPLSWTPSIDLALQNIYGENVGVTLYCDTFSGDGTQLGTSSLAVTCTLPSSIKPTCSVDIEDNTGSFAQYGNFLQGFSQISVAITAAGAYGSEIISYTSVVDGKPYTGATYTTEPIVASGMLAVRVTVKDSRQRTTVLDYQFEVVEYDPPYVSRAVATRCNEDGTEYYKGEYIKLIFTAGVTSLNGLNSANYKVEYKKQSDSYFLSLAISEYSGQPSVTDGEIIFPADNGSSYNLYVIAEDDFTEGKLYVFSPSVFRLMHFGADGRSMSFFKRCEEDGIGDFGAPIKMSAGYRPAVADSVDDMNDLTTPGFYVSSGMSIDNAPFPYGDFSCEVTALSEDMKSLEQRGSKLDPYDGSHVTLTRFRHYNSTTDTYEWSQWEEVYSRSDHSHSLSSDKITGILPVSKLVGDSDDSVAIVAALKAALVDTIYPVGAIYMSASSTSPQDLFGGYWDRIQDTFLLAAGSSYAAGSTGGAESHYHVSPIGYADNVFGFANLNGTTPGGSGKLYRSITAPNAGSSLGGNINMGRTMNTSNMPPYTAVYVWKRTA